MHEYVQANMSLLLVYICTAYIYAFSKVETQLQTFSNKVFISFPVSLAHWIEERQKVYEARQRRVEAICHKNNVSTMSSNDTMEDLINFSVHNDSATGE